MHEIGTASGWLPTGFQALVFVGSWLVAVLLHGLFWRSLRRPEPDPPRPSGPGE